MMSLNKMGIIYKATNNINGKVYIGQTRCTLIKRWDEHIRDLTRDDSKLSRAIRKYGNCSFTVEEIESVNDNMLNEREQYWIEKYNSYHNGYNSTLGGSGFSKINKDKIILLWNAGFSSKEIQKITGYCSQSIAHALETYSGYSQEECRRRGRNQIKKKVNQYDLDGNYIQTFDSATDAAKFFDVDRTLINICCRKKRPSGCGYQWRYADDEHPGRYCDNNKFGCSSPFRRKAD